MALRYLIFKKKQTLLILIGIILGTSAYVSISGMMLGFQTYILDRLVNNTPHVSIKSRESFRRSSFYENLFFNKNELVIWARAPYGVIGEAKINHLQFWYHFLEKNDKVKSFSQIVATPILFSFGEIQISGMTTGSIADKQQEVSNIESFMKIGKFLDLKKSKNGIILGKILFEKLGVKLGQYITLSTSKAKEQKFKVIGIFELGIKDLDSKMSFINLIKAQELSSLPNSITEIGVKLTDPVIAKSFKEEINNFTNEEIETWEETNAGILSVFKTQDIVRNFMTISIIIVAGFGIYNILSILVAQKKRDMAILKAIGHTGNEIAMIFIYQGLLLGLIGGILGLLIGYFICVLMSTIEVSRDQLSGSGGKMLVSFEIQIYIKAIILSLSTSVLSAIFPAISAKKLTPIEILRDNA